ncbi:hypothetical protein BSKO_11485 [Bryopsis sp. KO-2023]|nr:hypothetical protein BSKO_11485 [Bryopsis sp. KO-2023]
MEFFWSLLALLACAPVWFVLGELSRKLRFPAITGCLLGGFLCSQRWLGILSEAKLSSLWSIDHTCLAFVAFAAGAELKLSDVKQAFKQVVAVTAGIAVFTWVYVCAILALLVSRAKFDPPLKQHHTMAMATLGATLMIARSPASAIAVLREVEGRGPFCSLVIAVIVAKDVLVIVAFALNIELARVLDEHAHKPAGPEWHNLLEPFANVFTSITVGCIGMYIIGGLIVSLGGALRRASRVWPIVILGALLGLFQATAYLKGEPLLACMVAGLITANSGGESVEKLRGELDSQMEKMMPFVNTLFFGLIGASLKVGGWWSMAWFSVVIFAVRLVALYCGCRVGCVLGSCSKEQANVVWMTMVTQAGVALGLARMVGVRFPGWGHHFQTVMVSTIILNLISGPPLLRFAVVTVGEFKSALKAVTRIKSMQDLQSSDPGKRPAV